MLVPSGLGTRAVRNDLPEDVPLAGSEWIVGHSEIGPFPIMVEKRGFRDSGSKWSAIVRQPLYPSNWLRSELKQ
jgi:hypothetical protein